MASRYCNMDIQVGHKVVNHSALIRLVSDSKEAIQDDEDDIYKVKPIFWNKWVSRFFTVGFIASLIFLVVYLAASYGVEIDFDILFYMQMMDIL